ncbi:hypothetical protein H4582DRAFT_2071699 [Lactarius indigo]|nr:hypothetical protein H4582DRAFT_2071699 [Lactarius indigo]
MAVQPALADTDFGPIFFGYAVLFIDPEQVVRMYGCSSGEEFDCDLGSGFQRLPKAGQKVLIGDETNAAVAGAIGLSYVNIVNIARSESLIVKFKAIKNATEIEGFCPSRIRDGSPLLSESQGADQLEKFRQASIFKDLSFTTISSTGPNGESWSSTRPALAGSKRLHDNRKRP